MGNYFADCSNVAAIKSRYRDLAMQHHPDRGGDVRAMQEVNSQYHTALSQCDGEQLGERTNYKTGETEAQYYRYSVVAEKALADKLAEALGLGVAEIDLVGTWLWIEKRYSIPFAKKLSELEWSQKRTDGRFYWHPDKTSRGRRKYFSKKNYDDITDKYGVASFKSNTSGYLG